MKKRITISLFICLLLGLLSFGVLAETGSSSSSAPSSSDTSSASSDNSSEPSSSTSSQKNSSPIVTISSGIKTSSKSTTGSKSNSTTVSKDPNDGEVNTSNWGNSNGTPVLLDENGNPIVSSTPTYTGKKDILNVSALVARWIWVPILFMLLSIGALVYVNSKRFKGTSSDKVGTGKGRRKAPKPKKSSGNYRKPRD